MRHILAWVAFGLFLAAAVRPPQQAFAQQDPAEQRQKSAEFGQLYESWRQTRAPDRTIELGERLLALERVLADWPLQAARAHVKGELWFGLGSAYAQHRHGDPADNLEKAIAHLEAALTVRTRHAMPDDWAQTQNDLGVAYRNRIRGDRADNLEKAIAACEAALTVRTRETSPREWAEAQHNLAAAYRNRVRGDRADNVEKAIAAYEAALTVRTRDASPHEWAETQNTLGNGYMSRIRGNRADNVEKAIAAYAASLTVRTRETSPLGWVQAQTNLGDAYRLRMFGDRADNLEKAIAAYEAALEVRSREVQPREWAGTMDRLALAYVDRIHGDQADNVEKAIGHYETALTLRTRELDPKRWAQTQHNLSRAYRYRIRGDRADNLEKAIAAAEAALTVMKLDESPRDWAWALNNLGNAYSIRISGNRAESVEKAIAAFEKVLTVAAPEIHSPVWVDIWAQTQNDLGNAYRNRVHGDRPDNMEKAIDAYNAALMVRPRELNAYRWAQTQTNLAVVYADRVRGDRAGNLEKAIAAAEAGLTVRTREALPREHLRTARLLGSALLEKRQWGKADLAYASAREANLLLFGQGLNEAEARDLIADAGPLFAEAAFAAAELGESERALGLASEGRARLMAVALKLQALDLPGEKRPRLDELRAAIRTADRTVEATQGSERAAAVGKLASLRRELLELIKEADAAASTRGTALAQARALVAKGGAVVVPIVTKVGGKVLIVTPGSAPAGLTLVDLPELTTDRLDRLMRGDGRDGRAGGWLGAYNINYLPLAEQHRRWDEWLKAIADIGPELWHLFGAKLDAALKEVGVKAGVRLVWLPSGALGILPLGLTQDPTSKRRLADAYEIVYAPSLEALASPRTPSAAPATLAAVVNPTEDLAGTEKEGKLVASYFARKDRTVLERTAATPDAVLAALKGKTHWHFASHGTFSWQDARQSALLMHGQAPLSVGRLLETDGLGRPRLVVLSACETGLYDIERNPDEFIGLPGTFTALGASGVVGTLWPVSDAATALLIAKFYELHMGGKLAPPTALARAQAWLRQATNAELEGHARMAAKQGRLEVRHVAEIERELSDEGLARSRNAAVTEWIAPSGTRAASKKTGVGSRRAARPYAHPYFWAGFIYTGF